MKVHLCAGFGEPIGHESMSLYRMLGFEGIRQDVPPGAEDRLVREFVGRSLIPSFVVGGGSMPLTASVYMDTAEAVAHAMALFGVGGSIEIGNEPNLTEWAPDDFADLVRATERAVHLVIPQIPLIIGGISTTSEDGLDYLQRTLDAGVPSPDSNTVLGFHTYRPSGGSARTPHRGFQYREDEFRRLKSIAGEGRRLWNTEVGFHDAVDKVTRNAPFCWLPKRSTQRTEDDCAEYLLDELEINQQEGVEVVTVYQAHDGRSDRAIDSYGIQRADMSLKPSAHVVEAFRV